MKKLTLIITILLLGQVSGETIVVDQSGAGDYTTIQTGLSNTVDGDTVLVKPGTYIEGVTFPSRKVYLIGSGAEVTKIYYISRAVNLTNSSVLSGFTIESTTGVAVRATDGTIVTLKNCILDGGGSNYAIEANNINLFNNVIINSTKGLSNSGSSTKVQNNIFYDGEKSVYNSGGTITVENNIFYNTTSAIFQQSAGNHILSIYNCFGDNNSSNFINGAVAGLGDLQNTDPKFEDITKSYLLKSDSPVRDAGNPNSTYNDGDGSRNDMGIYGGKNTWGDGPVITNLSISPTTIDQGGTITIQATAKKN